MKTKLPSKVKKYLDSGRKKIIRVTPNNNFTLDVVFDNGETRTYDMSNKLIGVFEMDEFILIRPYPFVFTNIIIFLVKMVIH